MKDNIKRFVLFVFYVVFCNMKHSIKKINWIDCIFIPMDWAHSVTTRVWVKAWSDYERDKEWWISHFLEHLGMNWWKKWKKWYELKDFVRNMWWEVNASTSDYRTAYYVNSPYEYIKEQIEVLWDVLVDALYLDSETEIEKGIVIQEIDMSKDDNFRLAYCEWRRFFMWDCSYSRDALWTKENIMWFSKDDFLSYKKSLYTKDNIVIVVAWKINDERELKALIGETFGKLSNKKTRSLPSFERNFPNEHVMFLEKWINEPNVGVYIRWVNRASEDSVPCSVLADIIKWRLHRVMREELWLCYWTRCIHYSQLKYWFFRIWTWLKKDKLSFWLEKINEVIDDLLKNWIGEAELKNIINGKRGSMLLNYETPVKVADFVADNYIMLNKVIFPEDRAEEFSNVTMKDIEDVLPLLERENRYTFYVK